MGEVVRHSKHNIAYVLDVQELLSVRLAVRNNHCEEFGDVESDLFLGYRRLYSDYRLSCTPFDDLERDAFEEVLEVLVVKLAA